MNSHLDGGDADNAHNNISPKFWQTHAVQKKFESHITKQTRAKNIIAISVRHLL